MAKKIDKVLEDMRYVQAEALPVLRKLEDIRRRWDAPTYGIASLSESVFHLNEKLTNLVKDYQSWMEDDSPAPPDDTPDTPEGNKTGGGKEVH